MDNLKEAVARLEAKAELEQEILDSITEDIPLGNGYWLDWGEK